MRKGAPTIARTCAHYREDDRHLQLRVTRNEAAGDISGKHGTTAQERGGHKQGGNARAHHPPNDVGNGKTDEGNGARCCRCAAGQHHDAERRAHPRGGGGPTQSEGGLLPHCQKVEGSSDHRRTRHADSEPYARDRDIFWAAAKGRADSPPPHAIEDVRGI